MPTARADGLVAPVQAVLEQIRNTIAVQPSVEALGEGILLGLARGGVVPLDPGLAAPL